MRNLRQKDLGSRVTWLGISWPINMSMMGTLKATNRML